VCQQVIKLFVSSRVSLKTLSTLPGMEPLPEVSLPVNPDEKPKPVARVRPFSDCGCHLRVSDTLAVFSRRREHQLRSYRSTNKRSWPS
jgi:hypothetical protein